uniref:Uncharacterized protein n=1 Tax=Setaria italica TaxID=4555 RepID=K3ZKU0_SETIT
MEGKRTATALMVIMCLVILSLNVNPATAAQCSCCASARSKACCFACITAVAAKMEEMGVLANMDDGQA